MSNKFVDKRDLVSYNEELVIRGELLFLIEIFTIMLIIFSTIRSVPARYHGFINVERSTKLNCLN